MPIDGSRTRTNQRDGAGLTGLIRATYDFTVHGGAIGNIILGVTPDGKDAAPLAALPLGTTILDGFIDVLTAVTSAGAATIALQLEAAGDLLAAAILGTNGTLGRHALTPTGPANAVKVTTNTRQPTLVVGTAALTAGKFILVARYVVTG